MARLYESILFLYITAISEYDPVTDNALQRSPMTVLSFYAIDFSVIKHKYEQNYNAGAGVAGHVIIRPGST
jgi:hypothetical protein